MPPSSGRGPSASAPAASTRGLGEARADVIAGGAEAILVLPIDLPFVTPEAIDGGRRAARSPADRVVVLVTDRHGTGTNALALRPPDVIDFAFGPGSRRRAPGRRRGSRRDRTSRSTAR